MITIMSQMVKFITFYQVFDDKITGCNNCKNRKRESIFNGHRFDMQISIPKTPSYLWELFHGDIRKVNFLGGLFEIIACIIMSIFTNSLNTWYIN